MTIQTENLISGIYPEIQDILVSNRREFFRSSVAKLGLMASAPVLLAATAQSAFGQELPQEIVDVLVFALTLEHIEDAFYRSGLDADGLIPEKYVGIFNQIDKHEAAHVAFLTAALGSAAIKRPKLDLTAGGKYADALTNFDTYLTLSRTFEDLGVAAYKGQAGVVAANDDTASTNRTGENVQLAGLGSTALSKYRKIWTTMALRRCCPGLECAARSPPPLLKPEATSLVTAPS